MDFEQFVEANMASWLGFATAMCSDRYLAEDLVQEVLIRVHARWGRVGSLQTPQAYVRRAVVNEYLSWRRKWARIIPHAEPPAPVQSAPDIADEYSRRSDLAAELARLQPRQRVVLVLRYYVGQSDAEIATTLGCREATVRGYARRGLVALRADICTSNAIMIGEKHAY